MGASVKLIVEDSLRVLENGYAFDVRLNWYRSLPLSSVEILEVKLDGQPVPPDSIEFQINQRHYSLKDLLEKFDEYWFVQDHAGLLIRQPGRVLLGEMHSIEVEISLRFPYMMIGPGRFLTNVTHYATSQVTRQGR